MPPLGTGSGLHDVKQEAAPPFRRMGYSENKTTWDAVGFLYLDELSFQKQPLKQHVVQTGLLFEKKNSYEAGNNNQSSNFIFFAKEI